MGTLAFLRRALVGLAGALIVLTVMVIAAHADELAGVTERAIGLVIHDPAETLERYCATDSTGTLWLALPEVRAAIAGVRYPLGGIDADVFLLPYPRRSGLTSAAAPGLVLLSPGVRPVAVATQHATVTHELGHLVHLAHMPDDDADAWSRWRALRGVTDATVYCASAPHADRPHEIFAEDFRVLFGDGLAATDGGIENAGLAPPGAVPGLDAFVRALAGGAAGLTAWPNPGRGAIAFTRAGGAAGALDVFDVTGRRVATLTAVGSPTGWSWFWDGRGDDGRSLPAGRYLAHERGIPRVGTPITRLR
jgi:hypothetical protein